MEFTRNTTPIVIGHTIYAFKDGGMERGLLNIINYGDWDRFHHVIMCLTEAGAFAKRLSSPTHRVVQFNKQKGNDLKLSWRIAEKARQFQVSILHARGWPTLLETAVAARLAGVRQTIYGFHGKTLQELKGTGMKRQIAERLVVRSYDRVVTLNARMRADFAKNCGLPEDRIDLIANGVDVTTFAPRGDRHALRVKFGIPTDRFVVGNVARLDAVKNHEVILRAIARSPSQQLRPYFILVGEGPHRVGLESEIGRLGLYKDVRLFGYSDYIRELLNCMDLYIQSSFYEGFSNTVLEAMACGLPVLATDVGGTADLFSQGVEGWLFSPNDDETLASLIVQLERDPSLRNAGLRGRQRVVQNFSVQTMVRQYESLYSDLATEKHRSRTNLWHIADPNQSHPHHYNRL
jgi:sugar transferase (PEP-CTERM/EpsH1 system associated)